MALIPRTAKRIANFSIPEMSEATEKDGKKYDPRWESVSYDGQFFSSGSGASITVSVADLADLAEACKDAGHKEITLVLWNAGSKKKKADASAPKADF